MNIRLKRVIYVVLLLLVVMAAYYAFKISGFMTEIQKPKFTTNNGTAKAKEPPPVWTGTERVNILLMGIDQRDVAPEETPRSDSMMMVSINPENKTYDLFSVMRDTYVKIPEHGKQKINNALALGGPELAMKTVSEYIGQPVHYYVITDFEGFKKLIDAIGGVEIDVEKNMKYYDPVANGKYSIDLKKGVQQLDGEKALQYVRFRYDVMSDYTRTERQRKLIGAVASELKSTTTIFQIPKILDSIQPYIQTNMSSMDMIKLGSLGISLQANGEGHQLPPMNMFQEKNLPGGIGASLVPDVEAVQRYVREHLEDKPNEKDQNDANTTNSTSYNDVGNQRVS
ncbi:LCP family protein [Brevibacillus daliensis]|uniref:LCP family protein n=1 Tax=Brevibacillus daliensis TaxID=2892995 RepID=UPI001E58F1C9|nr:LCP family protein [Brevibacillus daliensis]